MSKFDTKTNRYYRIFAIMVLLFVATTPQSFAMVAPAAGSFAYDIYDIGVNSILKGAIGFMAGIAVLVVGIILVVRQMIVPGVFTTLSGAALLKADTIVTSMGLIC